MANYPLSLSSSTYKNHILKGLAQLQQSEKFVDMTLAAEGHWVKVHQTVVALASPYFRELLESMPCQHPVIYLYGVSHEALGLILEYMYTGQVDIPADKLQSFLNTAKDMQIAGLKNVAPPDDKKTTNRECQNKYKKQTSSTTVNSTTNNKNVSDLIIQTPTIVIPLFGNEDKKHDNFFSINVPTSSVESEACHDTRPMNESSNLTNMTLDELAATNNDISQKPGICEFQKFQNTTKISEPIEAININFDDSTLTNRNISQIPLSDIFENTINANAPGKEIKINSDNSTAMNDNSSNQCLPTTNTVQNINGPGKIINITLDETASNEDVSHKPVARIEILSNTLINSNTGVNFTGQGQLPELDTKALTSNGPTDKVGCSSQMDISKLLDFLDDPMDQGNTSSFETSAQGRNIGKTADMIHTGDTEVNEVVQQGKHIDPVLYTLSNRGALQLIMNRFMYYCHYQREEGHKKRWRCIDYREGKCLAAIDTIGEEIVGRKHKHCHPNHENKIKSKLYKDNLKVFSTIEMAQKFTKRESKKK